MSYVFHAGEREVQARAGTTEMADSVGQRIIHDFISGQAQAFLEMQSMVIIGSIDNNGGVWASLLSGVPGFMGVQTERLLHIDAVPSNEDPLHANLQANPDVGLIAIEFAKRRRARLNGNAQVQPDGTLQIQAREVYHNCPKYIQARTVQSKHTPQPLHVTGRSTTLTASQQKWIAHADTFFIATAAVESGADVSHRGGNPGFVQVVGSNNLLFPDYQGNMMFNTLGNLVTNPHAGLLFFDFDQGKLLQLTGKAEIIWDEAQIAAVVGAERLVSYEVTAVVESECAMPFEWKFQSYSPANP
ncbi:MAG: pyridoxamine 5'-phosphate oxidase family protein [Chloroflexota bacterium]